jgi:hypothetical protein
MQNLDILPQFKVSSTTGVCKCIFDQIKGAASGALGPTAKHLTYSRHTGNRPCPRQL